MTPILVNRKIHCKFVIMSTLNWCLSAVLLVSAVCHVMSEADNDRPPKPHGGGILGHIKDEDIDKCLNEVGLTRDEFHSLRMNKNAEPTEKELCMDKCIGLTTGAMNKDGTINIDYIKTHMSPAVKNDEDTIIPCLEKAGTITTCQDMENVVKCFPKVHKPSK